MTKKCRTHSRYSFFHNCYSSRYLQTQSLWFRWVIGYHTNVVARSQDYLTKWRRGYSYKEFLLTNLEAISWRLMWKCCLPMRTKNSWKILSQALNKRIRRLYIESLFFTQLSRCHIVVDKMEEWLFESIISNFDIESSCVILVRVEIVLMISQIKQHIWHKYSTTNSDRSRYYDRIGSFPVNRKI